MPQGGAWSNSNKNQMLSNVRTVGNQGGGEKKAGFPYQIGRSSWSNVFILPTSLSTIGKTMVFTKNTVRPTGNDPRIAMR